MDGVVVGSADGPVDSIGVGAGDNVGSNVGEADVIPVGADEAD
jgi:hypothetical protein